MISSYTWRKWQEQKHSVSKVKVVEALIFRTLLFFFLTKLSTAGYRYHMCYSQTFRSETKNNKSNPSRWKVKNSQNDRRHIKERNHITVIWRPYRSTSLSRTKRRRENPIPYTPLCLIKAVKNNEHLYKLWAGGGKH